MELINATGMQAGYTMGLQPDGRELLVVVVKGTFTIPEDPKKEPELAEEQVPLVEADVFTGEPGFSAPLYESDYAPRSRAATSCSTAAPCPGGKPAERVTVSLRVGPWQSRSTWSAIGSGNAASARPPTNPEPFTVMPISYDNAFGGVDRSREDPAKHRWYPLNHAGVGYHEYLDADSSTASPAQHRGDRPDRSPTPGGNTGRWPSARSVGPGSRGPSMPAPTTRSGSTTSSRSSPADFDERYYQSAPEDQQIPYPQGGKKSNWST